MFSACSFALKVDLKSFIPYAGIYFLSSFVVYWISKFTRRYVEKMVEALSVNEDAYYNFQQKPVEEGEDVVYGFPLSQYEISQTLKQQSELEEIAGGNLDFCLEILSSVNPRSEFAMIVENKEQEEKEDYMGIYTNALQNQNIDAYSSLLRSIPNEILDQFKKRK